MAISERVDMQDGISGPAKVAGSAIDALSSKFQGLARKASGLTALGEALKSIGQTGQMAGAVISAIGRIGDAAFKAAARITTAFGKLLGLGKDAEKDKQSGNQGGGAGGGEGGGGQGGGGSGGGAAAMAAVAEKMSAFGKESIAAIVDMVKEMTAAVISSTMEFIRAGMSISIEAASFRTEAVEALDRTLGAGKGSREYDKLGKLARDIGIGREQAIAEFKRLNAAGFKEDAIPKLLEEMANIDRGRGAGSGMRLEKLLERTQAQGKLDMAGVKNAAKQLGINQDDVIKDLATRLHKTTDQVKQELKKGVDATKGQDAILAAVDKKFGGLAKKGAESIPALLGAISDQVTGLFDKVDVSPLQQTLKRVKEILDSEVGGELKAALNNLFGSVFTALFGETAKGGDRLKAIFKGVAEFINGMAAAVRVVVPLVSAFIRGLLGGAAALSGDKVGKDGWIAKLQKELPTLIPLFERAGRKVVGIISLIATVAGFFAKVTYAIIGFAVAVLGVLDELSERIGAVAGVIGEMVSNAADNFNSLVDTVSSAFTSIPDTIESAIGGIGASITGLGADMADAGGSIIDGLVNGITGNAQAVIDAVIGACGNAIQAAKHILGIASPSTVFEEIGGFTAMGMAGGVTKSTPHVTRAVAAMGGAAAAAAGGALGVPGIGGPAVTPANQNGGGPSAGGPVIVQATIQVKGNGSPAANQQAGEDVGAQIDAGIRAYFRKRAVGG